MIRLSGKIKRFKDLSGVNYTLKMVNAFATRLAFPQNLVQAPLATRMLVVNELARSAFIGYPSYRL